jgi:hypothetical protein
LPENQANACSNPLFTKNIFVAKEEFSAKEDRIRGVSMLCMFDKML